MYAAALIGYVLGLLTRIKNQPHGQPNRTASAEENPSSQARPIVVTYMPSPLTDEERAENEEDKRRKIRKEKLEIAGLIVLTIYTGFTGFIFWETKEATKATKSAANAATSAASTAQQQLELLREQMARDQAGIVEAAPDYTGEDGRFIIRLYNRGKAYVRDVAGNFTVSHKTLPEGKLIGTAQVIQISAGQLSSEAGLLNARELIVGVPNFNLNAVRNLQETVVIEGSFQYNNGFGNIIHETMPCQQYIGMASEQTGVFTQTSFERCDRVASSIERSKRIAAERQKR